MASRGFNRVGSGTASTRTSFLAFQQRAFMVRTPRRPPSERALGAGEGPGSQGSLRPRRPLPHPGGAAPRLRHRLQVLHEAGEVLELAPMGVELVGGPVYGEARVELERGGALHLLDGGRTGAARQR